MTVGRDPLAPPSVANTRDEQKPYVRRPRGLFRSRLTRRILAVNLIAPIFLGVGFLFFDSYKQTLYYSAYQTLETEAALIAAAIAEGAVIHDSGLDNDPYHEQHRLDFDQASLMLHRLARLADARARLFSDTGDVVSDSRNLMAEGGAIRVEDLDPPLTQGAVPGAARSLFDAVWPSSSDIRGLSTEIEIADPTYKDFPEVEKALFQGEAGRELRLTLDKDQVLSVAVPIQYYKHVLGAVMVSRPGTEIQESLGEVRIAVAEIFTFTLLITFLLSLYMAGTIARPLVRLAAAADRVRNAKAGRKITIPNYALRGDELGDLSEALRDMTEALWKRMDAIEGFAADVAHELKNPLTSLKSAVETAARMKDPEKQKRLMDIILHDVERLDRLITDISDASRLDAELSRTESEAVALSSLLEALVQLHEAEAERREVKIALNFLDPEDPLLVMAGEGRLVQVFRNLIVNALSFSPKGTTVRIEAGQIIDKLAISVEDEGPGIPPGAVERIFTRFYSERPAGEKFGQHSGLGLAISRQIVEAYGGKITAQNRHDEDGNVLGARFTVSLPAAWVPPPSL